MLHQTRFAPQSAVETINFIPHLVTTSFVCVDSIQQVSVTKYFANIQNLMREMRNEFKLNEIDSEL